MQDELGKKQRQTDRLRNRVEKEGWEGEKERRKDRRI